MNTNHYETLRDRLTAIDADQRFVAAQQAASASPRKHTVYQLPYGNIEASTPMICLTDAGFKDDTRYVARATSGEACEFATLSGAEHYLTMCHSIQLMKQQRAAVTHQRYIGPFSHPLLVAR